MHSNKCLLLCSHGNHLWNVLCKGVAMVSRMVRQAVSRAWGLSWDRRGVRLRWHSEVSWCARYTQHTVLLMIVGIIHECMNIKFGYCWVASRHEKSVWGKVRMRITPKVWHLRIWLAKLAVQVLIQDSNKFLYCGWHELNIISIQKQLKRKFCLSIIWLRYKLFTNVV